MQSYKFSLLFFLSILAILTLVLPENSNNTLSGSSYFVLNFNLSFQAIFISFLLAAFVIVLLAKNFRFSEMISFSAYTISSLCAILSKQILLAIIFFELMAIFGSFIIASGTKNDSRSAIRYSCVHFFIGVILTTGLAAKNYNVIIIGLLMNCACFPFSFWVVDTYPSASLHGASYLSLFTTKVSFLVMILHTYNIWKNYAEILVLFGTITAIYGIIFASIEQNIRKFLAYSLVGQMGILVMIGSLLSNLKDAVLLLTLNIIFSIFYQILFISIANIIILQTKTINFSRESKFISVEGICALIAIITMAAFPGTAGFVSKSYITAKINVRGTNLEIYENLYKILNLLLYSSVGLKFLYYTFANKNDLKPSEKDWINKTTMVILASICLIGGNPYLPIYNKNIIFNLVYNTENIWLQFISLLSTTLLFIPLRKMFLPRVSFKINIELAFKILITCIILLLNKLIYKTKRLYTKKLKNLTNLLIILYSSRIVKLKKMIDYNSVSFISMSSMFLMSILLVLLCLSR